MNSEQLSVSSVGQTPCIRLAAALHAACVELDAHRSECLHAIDYKLKHEQPENVPDECMGPVWLEKVGRHVALAVAAMPESVLRAWLLDPRVVGGEEIYRTLKAGAGLRAAGKVVTA